MHEITQKQAAEGWRKIRVDMLRTAIKSEVTICAVFVLQAQLHAIAYSADRKYNFAYHVMGLHT